MIIIQTRFPRSKKKRIRKKWQKKYGVVIIPQLPVFPNIKFPSTYEKQLTQSLIRAGKTISAAAARMRARYTGFSISGRMSGRNTMHKALLLTRER
jgi:hypothetical protein